MVLDEAPQERNGTIFPRGFTEENVRFELVRAGDIVTLNYGKSLVESVRTAGTVPVYGTNGRCGWNGRAMAEGPTVILGRKGMGPLGVEWVEGPFWVIDTAYYVTPKRLDVNISYLYYLTKYIGLNHLKDGTSNPSLSRDTFYAQLLPLPTYDEQRKVASLFRALDDKINLNRRMNDSLKAIARALFFDWFNKTRGQATTSVIENLIERGVLAVGDGYRAKRSELSDHGLPFARAGNLKNDFDFTDAEQLGQEGIVAAGQKIAKQFDVALTSKGSVGRLAQVTRSTPKFVYSPQLCYWRVLNPALLNPHVLFQWMKGPEFQQQLDAVKGQTDMADYVSLSDQRRMKMTLPGIEEQQRIGSRLEPLYGMIDSNTGQNATLASLRDTLLPKLLSGELRVKDAEKMVEAEA